MAARLAAIVLDLVRAAASNDELLRELFDSDAVGALAFALRWARKEDSEAMSSALVAAASSSVRVDMSQSLQPPLMNFFKSSCMFATLDEVLWSSISPQPP